MDVMLQQLNVLRVLLLAVLKVYYTQPINKSLLNVKSMKLKLNGVKINWLRFSNLKPVFHIIPRCKSLYSFSFEFILGIKYLHPYIRIFL